MLDQNRTVREPMSNLYEASLIVPMADNAGRMLPQLPYTVRRFLSEHFSGWTCYPVTGGWIDENGDPQIERSWRYVVAAPMTVESNGKLRTLAHIVRRDGRQDSVYLVLPLGEVEFITEDSPLPERASEWEGAEEENVR